VGPQHQISRHRARHPVVQSICRPGPNSSEADLGAQRNCSRLLAHCCSLARNSRLAARMGPLALASPKGFAGLGQWCKGRRHQSSRRLRPPAQSPSESSADQAGRSALTASGLSVVRRSTSTRLARAGGPPPAGRRNREQDKGGAAVARHQPGRKIQGLGQEGGAGGGPARASRGFRARWDAGAAAAARAGVRVTIHAAPRKPRPID